MMRASEVNHLQLNSPFRSTLGRKQLHPPKKSLRTGRSLGKIRDDGSPQKTFRTTTLVPKKPKAPDVSNAKENPETSNLADAEARLLRWSRKSFGTSTLTPTRKEEPSKEEDQAASKEGGKSGVKEEGHTGSKEEDHGFSEEESGIAKDSTPSPAIDDLETSAEAATFGGLESLDPKESSALISLPPAIAEPDQLKEHGKSDAPEVLIEPDLPAYPPSIETFDQKDPPSCKSDLNPQMPSLSHSVINSSVPSSPWVDAKAGVSLSTYLHENGTSTKLQHLPSSQPKTSKAESAEKEKLRMASLDSNKDSLSATNHHRSIKIGSVMNAPSPSAKESSSRKPSLDGFRPAETFQQEDVPYLLAQMQTATGTKPEMNPATSFMEPEALHTNTVRLPPVHGSKLPPPSPSSSIPEHQFRIPTEIKVHKKSSLSSKAESSLSSEKHGGKRVAFHRPSIGAYSSDNESKKQPSVVNSTRSAASPHSSSRSSGSQENVPIAFSRFASNERPLANQISSLTQRGRNCLALLRQNWDTDHQPMPGHMYLKFARFCGFNLRDGRKILAQFDQRYLRLTAAWLEPQLLTQVSCAEAHVYCCRHVLKKLISTRCHHQIIRLSFPFPVSSRSKALICSTCVQHFSIHNL
jgi:hypothetical protein